MRRGVWPFVVRSDNGGAEQAVSDAVALGPSRRDTIIDDAGIDRSVLTDLSRFYPAVLDQDIGGEAFADKGLSSAANRIGPVAA